MSEKRNFGCPDLGASTSGRSHLSFLAGTLPYMAPEQTGRINRSIDSRSDLYTLEFPSPTISLVIKGSKAPSCK